MYYFPNKIAYVSESGSQHESVPSVVLEIDTCLLTTPLQNTVFLAHGLTNMCKLIDPVEKITVIHVGSDEAADVSRYAETCTSIEFTGHMSSTNAVLGITSQLPKLEKVTIWIGHDQEYYYPEREVEHPWCPSVKTLSIKMARCYFEGLHDDEKCKAGDCFLSNRQHSLIILAQSLLIHAIHSFPNLEKLFLELPENEMINKSVQYLIDACRGLRNMTLEEVRRAQNDDDENNNMEGPLAE